MTVRAEIRPIPEPPREVVLTMPYDVAKSLYDILGYVGGKSAGYRGDADQLRKALTAVGFEDAGRRFSGQINGLDR